MSDCVVGVGNPFRGDDGAGIAVARLLRESLPRDVRVVECEGEPVALLDAWAGCDRVVLVDAVRSGAAAGTIRKLAVGEEPLPAWLGGTSTHLLGLPEAVELARTLGRLPGRLVLYAIEGGRFDAGEELSPSVAAAVPLVAAAIQGEVTRG